MLTTLWNHYIQYNITQFGEKCHDEMLVDPQCEAHARQPAHGDPVGEFCGIPLV